MEITQIDEKILKECLRWRCLSAEQIKEIIDFKNINEVKERLEKLIDVGYLAKKEYLTTYSITDKACKDFKFDMKKRKDSSNLLYHDLVVASTYIYFLKVYNILYEDFLSTTQIKNLGGHRPDLAFKEDEQLVCIEVELSNKKPEKTEENILNNAKEFKRQIWVVGAKCEGTIRTIKKLRKKAPDIEIEIMKLDLIKKILPTIFIPMSDMNG